MQQGGDFAATVTTWLFFSSRHMSTSRVTGDMTGVGELYKCLPLRHHSADLTWTDNNVTPSTSESTTRHSDREKKIDESKPGGIQADHSTEMKWFAELSGTSAPGCTGTFLAFNFSVFGRGRAAAFLRARAHTRRCITHSSFLLPPSDKFI